MYTCPRINSGVWKYKEHAWDRIMQLPDGSWIRACVVRIKLYLPHGEYIFINYNFPSFSSDAYSFTIIRTVHLINIFFPFSFHFPCIISLSFYFFPTDPYFLFPFFPQTKWANIPLEGEDRGGEGDIFPLFSPDV